MLTTWAPIAADTDPLLPEERALVVRMAPGRQREFATGRVCAREGLARLGIADFPLLRNDDRTPVWPEGIVGSISHTQDVCVVALARRADVVSLGVDVEPADSLEPELWPVICTALECERLADHVAEERGFLAKALFSAKECTYKCLYPILRTPLDFDDVEIDLDLHSHRFRATLAPRAEKRPITLTGSIRSWGSWIMTGMAVRRWVLTRRR